MDPGSTNFEGTSPAAAGADAGDRYRPLFDGMPDAAFIVDRETLRFLDVNDAMVRSYGWPREVFLQMTLHDIRPPGESGHLARVTPAIQAEGPFTAPSVHRTRAGQRRDVEIISYSLEFAGRPARMALVHDVTERRAAAAALSRSEENYRDVIEQLEDVFFRIDAEGAWTFLNGAWTGLTGQPVEDSLGTQYLGSIHPADRGAMMDALQPLHDGSVDTTHVEVRFFRREGGYRWVEVSTRAVREGAVASAGLMGTLRDVTERHAAEEERHRLSTNIRELLEASGEGIYGLDARGIVTFMNRRGSELLGYGPGELVGRALHETTHYSRADGTPFPVSECPIYRAATLGIPAEVDDDVMWRKDGIALQVEYSAFPLHQNGRVSGAVVNLRDISARKRTELELILARDEAEAASRAKSDFLARMSHELRTPLNSIIGFANVLLKNRTGSLTDGDLTYLGRIASNGRHLLGLINDILDISKIEAGRMVLDLAPAALDELVRNTLDELGGQGRDSDVALRAEIPEHVHHIEADAARVKQVLINLVGNALKFTSQGEVVVRLETDADHIPTLLEVRDTGIGIPPDRLGAIFNVFEQAETTITRRFGGTGLGLTISRSLCELMGYRLQASSVEGKGTTMRVFLTPPPLPPREGAGDPPSVVVTEAVGGPCLVLVVDDEPDDRFLLVQLINEVGCHAVTAASGVEGLRLARAIRPAMIFLDLKLPRISGFDILRILQGDDALREVPVVIVSAVASESRSALVGVAAVLDKPIDRDAVHEVLARLLSRTAR